MAKYSKLTSNFMTSGELQYLPRRRRSSAGASTGGAGALMFGLNMQGAEGSTPTFPTTSDWSYLQSKGITRARLPVAWENLQTTLGAALQTTYVNNIKAALAAASVRGMRVIVDLHNFGAYAAAAQWGTTVTYAGNAGTPATGVSFFGSGITSANFNDVWTKLSTALVGQAGLAGYSLMNEVTGLNTGSTVLGTNLLQAPNYFSTVGLSWFVFSGCVNTIQAIGTNPLGANYGPAWQITGGGAGNGGIGQSLTLTAATYTVSVWAKALSGTVLGSLQLQAGVGGTPFTATTTWQRFTFTGAATAGAQSFAIYVTNAGTQMLIANAQVELGSSATTYVSSNYMAGYAQGAINAIRAVDATTPIYVQGDAQLASNWQKFNYEYITLTGGNLIFDAHQYFDGPQGQGGGGAYSGTFASYSVDVQTGMQAIAPFLNWLTTVGGRGFIGELGVPNSVADNNPQWLVVQNNVWKDLLAANVPAAAWLFHTGGSDPLNVAPVGGVDDPRLTMMLSPV
jgi:hypothetical protein